MGCFGRWWVTLVTSIGVLAMACASERERAEIGDAGEVAILETSAGRIVLQFHEEDAPRHVGNFKKLARSGFYDGTYFHRVIPGFMVQGGDPNTKDDDRTNDGQGGPGYAIEAEFNARKHVRGTLSMARSRGIHTAGSQFFICVANAPHLDGQYTAFGRVQEGMETVDEIVSVPRDRRDNPLEPIYLERVTVTSSP
jgi:cyclophilin family peptidyl-prolyl cis-trans isomerase